MAPLTSALIVTKSKNHTRLAEIGHLNLWGQNIDNIDILTECTGLKVLSLSVNKIKSLAGVQNCTKLQELYLRKNLVADVSELRYLQSLRSLRILWLLENPIADHPDYRRLIRKLLPSLETLDNETLPPYVPDTEMPTSTTGRRPDIRAQMIQDDRINNDTLHGKRHYTDVNEDHVTIALNAGPVIPAISQQRDVKAQNMRYEIDKKSTGTLPPIEAKVKRVPSSRNKKLWDTSARSTPFEGDTERYLQDNNILFAALALIKELDNSSLRTLNLAIVNQMEST